MTADTVDTSIKGITGVGDTGGVAAVTSAVRGRVDELLAGYQGKFKREEIAATLIDLHVPNNMTSASIRGDERIYPASVVKMFYMAALERQLEDAKITLTPEVTRGLRDMILDSSMKQRSTSSTY